MINLQNLPELRALTFFFEENTMSEPKGGLPDGKAG